MTKTIEEILKATAVADASKETEETAVAPENPGNLSKDDFIRLLIEEMKTAAESLEYERAASIRDRILELKGEI